MTYSQEIRIRFSKTIEELDRLFALYGSGDQLFLDAKFLQEKAKESVAVNIMSNLIED